MSNKLPQNENVNDDINFFNNNIIPREIKLCAASVLEGAVLQFKTVPGKDQTMVQFYLFLKNEPLKMGSFTIDEDYSMGEINFKATCQNLNLGEILDPEKPLLDREILEKLAEKYSSNFELSQQGIDGSVSNFVGNRVNSIIELGKKYSTAISEEISKCLKEAFEYYKNQLDPNKKKQVTQTNLVGQEKVQPV